MVGVSKTTAAGRSTAGVVLDRQDYSLYNNQFVSNELKMLIASGVISETKDCPTCVSSVGVVPKHNGKLRLIVDPRRLNNHCSPPKFRYEDVETVCDLVETDDVLVTLALQDVFLSYTS